MKMRLMIAAIALLPILTQAKTTSVQAPSTHIVTDLTRDRVDISTRYTGDEITLFGAMSSPAQVVVKVTSPTQPISIEEKGRVGPFWLSIAKYDIADTPGLYFLLSSAPIDQLLTTTKQRQYGLSLAYAVDGMRVSPKPADMDGFVNALLRLKKAHQQYVVSSKAVKILGQRLFSTTIHLPAQLPLGTYRVDIYLVRNDQVLATEHRQIKVAEVHTEHWVSSVADNNSWLFGVSFTFAVMALGLFLGIITGRGGKKA